MKNFLITIVLLILQTTIIFAQAPQKTGYVDSQIILTQFPEAIKAQGDLDAITNLWSAQRDSMQVALQQGYADYQKQAETMAPDKKAAAEQNLIKMEQDLRQFSQVKFGQGTGEIYLKQEEIFNPVKAKIYKAIEDVAKEEGMQFVFDKSGDIILLYADSAFDITFKVLDKLKRGL
ncbi:MAG: OmpH family outer membrane protein [Ignavibacteriales bacterium]|nr:OmpH family outer membrane protein [Ignavibacteriales bacterium]